MPTVTPGVVSVVLVNFRGTDDTLEAISHLRELDWPAGLLEIVVVENGSGDDSAARLRAVDGITLVVSTTNEGFAGGCNLGVAESRGEYIALLNNDAKPDSAWIRAAVARFEQSPMIGAVASRVLDWDGELVDYIGSAMTWFGMGYKPFTAEPIPLALSMQPKDVLFGTGSAMFIRRDVYTELGGFDERYFMFFEDVDFGWRLNLAGYRFAYEPASLAFHKHHASMSKFGSHKETYLLERNALYTLYKNIGESAVAEAVSAAIGLSIRRGVMRGELDSTSFDLRKGGSDDATIEVSRQMVAAVFAIDQFVEHLPGLTESRHQIQRSRKLSEGDVWRLFGLADAPVWQDEEYLVGYENLVGAFDVTRPRGQTKVVVVTGDPIGAKLAGPAIRAWNMADLLSRQAEVTLVSLSGIEPVDAPFRIVHVPPGDDRAFGVLEAEADVIVFQGSAMSVFDSLRFSKKIIVVDIYDPMHLEQLEQGRHLAGVQWKTQVEDATDVLNQQLERGDFFLAASERQRLFWLGQLAGLGRINPSTYADDPDLRGLLDVVPFGLSSVPPRHERDVLKGVLPGISSADKVVLWGGGLYNWFDPKTLVRAIGRLSERRDSVRLFFQGTKHPHPGVPEMEIVSATRELARELGLYDRSVFFNSSWVDYADRANYLTEADAGVSTHFSHIETTFSFRTRILDYLWAELPMVVTEGDHFAELIERERLGLVVPAENVEALADALEKVLFDEEFARQARENIRRVRERYYWERALAPLLDFVTAPHHAADNSSIADGGERVVRYRERRKRSGWRHNVAMASHYLRNGGPRVVLDKVLSRLRRR
jgi:GT2 family glycosyltransferase/glycosyltransferase involved in cell wall biosynthesis